LNQRQRITLVFSILITVVLTVAFALVFAIPGVYVYIEIGRFVGPIVGLILIASLSISTYAICNKALSDFKHSMTKMEYSEVLNRKKAACLVMISLSLSILILSAFSLGFVSAANQSNKRIDLFVAQNTNESLQNYEHNLTIFLKANLKCSYNKPEILYKYDEGLVSYSLVGSWIMKVSGINPADFILFQGWGACGEAAIVLEQVMHDSGYETRLAKFKGYDHEWTEVENGTQWLIVDPWDIGNLVSIQTLGNDRSAFPGATGVEVQYYNSTVWVDANKEHGY
jgi:hypothetical protein